MSKKWKRVFSIALCLALLLTAADFGGFFDHTIMGDQSISGGAKELDDFAEEVAELVSEDEYGSDSEYQTKRLIVTAESDGFDDFGAIDTTSYGNIFVLSYDTEKAAKAAHKKLEGNKAVKSVEIDAVMEIETKGVTDKEIDKAMKISSYKDEGESEEVYDDYDPVNPNGYKEKSINNVDSYIKDNKLEQKKDVVAAIIDSGIKKADFNDDRIIDSKQNYSSSGAENDITDDNGHGTTMAKIIAEQTGNNVKIMPIKTVNAEGKCSILSAYLGIKYAMENGADIINISLNTAASTKSAILEDAVREADKKGIKVVASAGNDTDDVKYYSPSCIEEAYVISAADVNGTIERYSNFGKTIDFASGGTYKEEKGTSIAAANFSAELSKLIGAGVKNPDSAFDEITGFTEESEKNMFVGKGYVGDRRLVVPSTKKEVITGSAPMPADIRNLKDGAWKELSDREFDEYVKNSSYMNIGAFLSTLTKEELKEAVNKSKDLQKAQYTYKGTKFLRKNRKFEEALIHYSRKMDYLTTNDMTAFGATGNFPVYIGGQNKENWAASYCSIDSVTVSNLNLNTNNNVLTVTFGTLYNDPNNGITLSNFALANGYAQPVKTNSGNQLYTALYGQFYASVTEYYQSTEIYTATTAFEHYYDNEGNLIREAKDFRLNFDNYNGATAPNWAGQSTYGMDSDPNTADHDKWMNFQVNLVHFGITSYNDNATHVTYNYGLSSTLYFLTERPTTTLTLTAGEGVTGISPGSKQYYKGETGYLSHFAITVAPGYDPPADASFSMVTDQSAVVNATPHTYYINYYANNKHVHRTEDPELEDATEPESRQKVLYNRNFHYRSSIFEGYYILSYEDFASDLDTYDENGSQKKFLQESLNTDPPDDDPDALLTKNIDAWVAQWREDGVADPYDAGSDGGDYTWLNDRDLKGKWVADKYGTLPEPERYGFDFKGWYSGYGFDSIVRGNSGKGTKITATTTYKQNMDSKIYAKWERHKWTVTYDYGTNGGYKKDSTSTKTEKKECYYDYLVDVSPVGEKNGDTGIYDEEENPDGWQFVGWNPNPNATVGIDSYYMPDSDLTLYAIYKKEVTLTTVDADGDNTVSTTYRTNSVYNKNTNTVFMLGEGNKNCTFNNTHGAWELYGWSMETTAAPGTVFNKNTGLSIFQDRTIYGQYQRTMRNDFISVNGGDGVVPTDQQRNGDQKLNSYVDAAKRQFTMTSVTITTPTGYIYTGDSKNGPWSFVAWTHNPSEKTPTLINQNTSITVTEGRTYYAKYRRDLKINYVDYNGTQKRSYTTKHEQTTFADGKLLDYNSPDVTIAVMGDHTGWNDKMYWASSPDSLNSFYTQGEKITLTDNTDLYAVYQRQLTVTYKDYQGKTAQSRDSVKKNQRANASDINGTKQSITFNALDIRGYVDPDDVAWAGVYWSKDTASTAASFVGATRSFQVKDDTTLYAVYETTFENKFISRQNVSLHTATVQTPTRTNAYNVTNPNYRTLMVPPLQGCNYNSIAWQPAGWSESTKADADIALSAGQTYTVKSSKSFYGIYTTGTKVKFIDYQGSTKRQRQIDASSKLNSFSLAVSDLEVTMPEMGVYTKEGDWGTVGWTTSLDAKPDRTLDVGETETVNKDAVFYGVYKKNVTMTLVDFNSAVSSTARTRYLYKDAYVNSNDVSNEEPAVFTLPNQGRYAVNGRYWDSIGWDEGTEASTIASYFAGTEVSTIKDMTMYGMYAYNVTVTYNGNGGTSYSEPSNGMKTANAAGSSTAANVTISSSTPIRQGYVFMNKWSESAKDATGGYEPGKTYQFDGDTTLYAQWGIDTIDKKITVEWEDAGNVNGARPGFVYLTLYRDGEKTTQYLVSKIDNTVIYPASNTIIAANGQAVKVENKGNMTEYTFAGLQKYDADTGLAYKYTVKEEPVESLVNGLAYSISYPSDGVIKNTLVNTDGVKMNVRIDWDDGLNHWKIRPSNVIISLIQTDPDTHQEKVRTMTVVPEKTKATQTHTFNNVDLMNASQHMYQYRVRIDRLAGYSTTYGEMEIVDGIKTLPIYNVSTGLPTLYGDNYIIFSADTFRKNGNHATGSDFENIDIDEEEPVLITLKQIKKTWTGTGVNAEEHYNNNVYMHNDVNGTDVSYNVLVSPRVDTKLVKIPYGRYELAVHDNALFDFKNFSAANSEKVNADLDTINGKQYVTFSAKFDAAAIAKLHANLLIAEWRGYTCLKRRYQPMDYSLVTVRMPGTYDNLGYQTKTWNLLKVDGDIIVNGTTFQMKSGVKIDGELIISNEIQTIAAGGLAGQTDLINLTLPNNLKNVNGNAFAGCSRLRIVTYQGVKYTTNDALKDAFRRNGVTFSESAFTGVSLGY